MVKPDLILAGGGLANCLIAWRLAVRRPEIKVLILERDHRLGGNHTWSFHRSDLDAAQNAWVSPMVAHDWQHHQVRFPQRTRQIAGAYRSATSDRLHHHLMESGIAKVRFGAEISQVASDAVRLADGTLLEARAVIDGRGQRDNPHLVLGFQKFLGLEVELDEAHGLSGPVIMDATVSQADGYRFVYVLPFGARRLLIEDTRYSDGADLDRAELRDAVTAYAQDQGWRIAREHREERGILPILLAGDLDAYWNTGEKGVARSGLAAALFHPTTGYSLPFAVRLADAIAEHEDLSAPGLHALTYAHAVNVWRETGFFRLLNRMLFRAGIPERRYLVLQRFYGLSEALIARFYAARLTTADKIRLLAGKPPVPILPALACLSERALYRRESRSQ
ncbi:lycopene beta-cyclase CrtY [Aquisalimonas sp.]|uniref:lycopene beta-cyclase CrtY n=1 Tax=Aquisalimonas sp. TaxID=1872621 RepID=UPI0025BA245E|nr:lycopene beta-cyclase CrtY [Aquisalimonas sp.]